MFTCRQITCFLLPVSRVWSSLNTNKNVSEVIVNLRSIKAPRSVTTVWPNLNLYPQLKLPLRHHLPSPEHRPHPTAPRLPCSCSVGLLQVTNTSRNISDTFWRQCLHLPQGLGTVLESQKAPGVTHRPGSEAVGPASSGYSSSLKDLGLQEVYHLADTVEDPTRQIWKRLEAVCHNPARQHPRQRTGSVTLHHMDRHSHDSNGGGKKNIKW